MTIIKRTFLFMRHAFCRCVCACVCVCGVCVWCVCVRVCVCVRAHKACEDACAYYCIIVARYHTPPPLLPTFPAPPGRAIRFSKNLSDFCSMGLLHLESLKNFQLYKLKTVWTQRWSIYIVKFLKFKTKNHNFI